jgi:hypothetical protein
MAAIETPHDFYDIIKYYGYIFIMSIMNATYDIRDPFLYRMTEKESFIVGLSKYENVMNYFLNGYDLSVPTWSATYNLPSIKIDHTANHIEQYNITLHLIKRKFYAVPIHSLFAHANTVIGKHRDSYFTWDRHLVDNSMKHFIKEFK